MSMSMGMGMGMGMYLSVMTIEWMDGWMDR